MRRLILAALFAAGCTLLGSTQSHAFGWYRTNGDYAVATPGCYHFRSARWTYAAAYYQSYRSYRRGHRAHSRKCCR